MKTHRALVRPSCCVRCPAAPGGIPRRSPSSRRSRRGSSKFRSTTRLVVETVTVKDKNGKPVEGLTAKDFTITEDGVAQTISFCEFQKLDECGGHRRWTGGECRRRPPAPGASARRPRAPSRFPG